MNTLLWGKNGDKKNCGKKSHVTSMTFKFAFKKLVNQN